MLLICPHKGCPALHERPQQPQGVMRCAARASDMPALSASSTWHLTLREQEHLHPVIKLHSSL